MTSKHDHEDEPRGADTPEDANDSSEPEVKELSGSEDDQRDEIKPDVAADARERKAGKNAKRDKSPAYIAPIPKIPLIPPIDPSEIPLPPQSRPKLPKFIGSFLQGKKVDEFGDIVDPRTGQVLARAAGDLPSLVGRLVSNRDGDILGDNGELLGYVADVPIERKAPNAGGSGSSNVSPRSPSAPTMRSLDEYMGRNMSAFRVDHTGNILDSSGSVVGKFHDRNNPLHRYMREEEERKRATSEPAAKPAGEGAGAEEKTEPGEAKAEEEAPLPQGEQPRRENAASHRREDDSPSDIFLDVKSTRDGIQITIRIPTVFNGQQVQPRVQFS